MKKVLISLLIVIGMITWVGCSDNSQENVQETSTTMMQRQGDTIVNGVKLIFNEQKHRFEFDPSIKFSFKSVDTSDKTFTPLEGVELAEWEALVEEHEDVNVKFNSDDIARGRCRAIRSLAGENGGPSLWYSTCGKWHVYCNGRWYAYEWSAWSQPYNNLPSYLHTPCGIFEREF